jgi:exodeoxyribonuclease VII large subunit
VARALPTPDALFASKRQKLDLASAKLGPALSRNARDHENRLNEAARALARFSPASRVSAMRARLNAVGQRPHEAIGRVFEGRAAKLGELGKRLSAARTLLQRAEITRIGQQRETVHRLAERLAPAFDGQLARKHARLASSAQLFDSLNYKSVLARGFALVRDGEGRVLRSALAVADGQPLMLEFVDGTAEATGGRSGKLKAPGKSKPAPTEQGALF